MQLLLIVLNRVEKLDDLLEQFMELHLSGATIMPSTGMVKELCQHMEDYPIIGSFRHLIDSTRQESKTIFMVLKEEQLETARQAVRDVIGDLSCPDTAIMFTLPVMSVEGVAQ